MTASLDSALAYAKEHDARFLEELVAWCAIPSVSSQAEHKADMQRAAEWGAERLRRAGLQNVAIVPTAGHPVVYGDWLGAGPEQPTVLVYGHYDVQPAGDLSLWQSQPFEPRQRDGCLYARGASDMKGQAMAAIAAVEAHLHAGGSLPINVKFLIEGEEEIGSRNLRELIRAQQGRLACDYSLNNDSGMPSPGQPAITYGLRGVAGIDLTVLGPRGDVHSGIFGGVLHNPVHALCELIAGMHDERGRITLPGFYDRVRPLESDERAFLAEQPAEAGPLLEATGAPALWGEPEFTPYERTAVRPSLDTHAIRAGAAKKRLAGWRATLVDRNNPGVQAVRRALLATWGVPPLFFRRGGSVPVTSYLDEEAGIPSAIAGFTLPDDNIHGPNERLHLVTWRRGIEAMTRFFQEARRG